jgi:hypothetical protein
MLRFKVGTWIDCDALVESLSAGTVDDSHWGECGAHGGHAVGKVARRGADLPYRVLD